MGHRHALASVGVVDSLRLDQRCLVFFSNRASSLFRCCRDLSQCVDSTLRGYDVVIMSDLLHFDASHKELVLALRSLLASSTEARVYVAAGKYTAPRVCDNFLNMGVWKEGTSGGGRGEGGSLIVGGLDAVQLGIRKRMCRWWVGRWGGGALSKRTALHVL